MFFKDLKLDVWFMEQCIQQYIQSRKTKVYILSAVNLPVCSGLRIYKASCTWAQFTDDYT